MVALIGDEDNSFPLNNMNEALSFLGIADAVITLKAEELDQALIEFRPTILVLGNEYKDKKNIQKTLQIQRQQGGTAQFHAGEAHYATADLLSNSERDLREQRRELFQSACRRQSINSEDLLRN